jgi:flagellar assembly protein FliH
MKNARKFEFGLSFDPPGTRGTAQVAAPVAIPEPLPEPEPEEPPPPPEPTFSQEEMHETRHQGWLEGRAAGEADAMERNERRLADTIERLSHDLEGLAGSQQATLARVERQSTELAVQIVRKLFPAFVARSGTVEIQALIADALSLAQEQPKLALRCAPDMIEAIEPILTAAATRSGFEGRLSVRGDPDLTETDCKIEWNEGGMDRDSGRLMNEIESAIARGLQDFDRRFGSDGAGTSGAFEENRS